MYLLFVAIAYLVSAVKMWWSLKIEELCLVSTAEQSQKDKRYLFMR